MRSIKKFTALTDNDALDYAYQHVADHELDLDEDYENGYSILEIVSIDTFGIYTFRTIE